MNTPLLVAQNIHKSINSPSGNINILEGVDLQINPFQSVAIVGQSGSGKSTLLSLLAGLDIPQRGEIHMYGQDICRLTEDQRAQIRSHKTGFVFQSFYLMQDLTALENVALPLELFGHKGAEKTALKWLQKLGLENRAKHFPKQLSGGEQQRVALARAFALNPEILFADEPTANLDSTTAQQVIDQLFKLHKDNQNSMVLVTHDQDLADRCDVVYHLHSGKLHHA